MDKFIKKKEFLFEISKLYINIGSRFTCKEISNLCYLYIYKII